MFGSIGKLIGNRKGAFAIQFALMAVPLTVCTGLAIDGGRAFLAHYELGSALDAAALAAGSNITQGANLDAVAQKFVDANFHTPHEGVITLKLDNTDPDVLKLQGKVRIATYFMPLVGQNYVDVSAESQVRRGGNNVEVALALDITQSMSGSKITALRVAANDLIDTVINSAQSPFFSRAAIVPWGTNVHLGTYAATVRGPVTGTTAISGANWRASGTSTQTLAANTGWRTNTGKALSTPGIAWKSGSAMTLTKVTKASSHIQVTFSGTSTTFANGDFVYFSGVTTPSNNSYTILNGNKYVLADKATTTSPSTTTYTLKDTSNAYIAAPSGTTNATAGSMQECLVANCELQVTASSHGFSTGAYVNIMGITESGSSPLITLNNTATTTYTVGATTTGTFNLAGTNGPAYKAWSSGGTASNCFVSDCRYQVTTTANHGFSNGHYVFINGFVKTGTAGTTTLNNTANTSWTISGATGKIFYLPGTGNTYQDWGSAGSVYDCLNATCNVQVTSTSHGFSNNDWTEIANVAGITGINSTTTTPAWQITGVSGNNFLLKDTTPALANMATAFSGSAGTSQCLKEGCQKFRYLAINSAYQIRAISNCGSERVGTSAHTDDAPAAGAYIGRDYPGVGSLVGCVTGSPPVNGVGGSGNYLTPLTANKTILKKAITDMTVSGSTAGQIGAEWAWYMLSPKWSGVWPGTPVPPGGTASLSDTTFDPMPYETHELAKVAILMTDGAFNTAHCKGVTTETYHYEPRQTSQIQDSDLIDSDECTAAAAPFAQALATCTEMKKDQKITIYTVGFEVGNEAGAADFLTKCATDTSHVFLAADETALKAAFKKIASSISKLRISK